MPASAAARQRLRLSTWDWMDSDWITAMPSRPGCWPPALAPPLWPLLFFLMVSTGGGFPLWSCRQDLPPRLAKEGVVVLEIGNEKDFFEAAFPDLPVFWLDTSSGDGQVLLITQEALRAWTEGDIEALRPQYRPLG